MSSTDRTEQPPSKTRRLWRRVGIVVFILAVAVSIFVWIRYESYTPLYDATFVGSPACADCHPIVDGEWQTSPHALMVRNASNESVVGDFENHVWKIPGTEIVAAKMERDGDTHRMLLRRPDTGTFESFEIEAVVGFQYRQTYLHKEDGGVLRRLPLQWSAERREYFPYWNLQEGSEISVEDLWAQRFSQNSAWNLFCARCHVTNLQVLNHDVAHRTAETHWTEHGISCEACHGPGSAHVDYFEGNYANRVMAFMDSKLHGEPVAYIANAPKMDKGRAMSICARCHGPDIMLASTDTYRMYEPGYSAEGRVNDLSPHFKEFPLQPGRTDPTVECWDNGKPKGIGMLFRSFVESSCYDNADVRCYDCHNPHANKLPTKPGLLHASEESNRYCLNCHEHLRGYTAAHSHHDAGTSGSFCYDCHMPHQLQSIVSGVEHFRRTHEMSSIPDPKSSIKHGVENAPNACNECHSDQTAEWAADWMDQWWPQQ